MSEGIRDGNCGIGENAACHDATPEQGVHQIGKINVVSVSDQVAGSLDQTESLGTKRVKNDGIKPNKIKKGTKNVKSGNNVKADVEADSAGATQDQPALLDPMQPKDVESTLETDPIGDGSVQRRGSNTQFFSLVSADDDDGSLCSPQPSPGTASGWPQDSEFLDGFTNLESKHFSSLHVMLFLMALVCAVTAMYMSFFASGIERSARDSSSPDLAGVIVTGIGNPECWIDGYSFGTCCDPKFGEGGNAHCWDAVYNYRRCCFPRNEL